MENNNTLFSLYRIKNLILQYEYYNKLNIKNNYYDIISLMNNYINNLKEINLIYTVSDIEAIKYGITGYPNTLFNNEIINSLCFYTLILGFFDANIDFIKGKNTREFNYNSGLDKIKSLRNRVCIDYDEFNNIKFIDLKEFNYNNIDKLFNLDNLNLLEGLFSYVVGYMNLNKYNCFKIYTEYIKLMDELNTYKNKNKEKFEKAKIKKRKI